MNWGLVIVCGLLLTVLAQAAACIFVFRHNATAGLLSLVVPGYLFFALKRSGPYFAVLGAWFAGVLAVTAGTIALS